MSFRTFKEQFQENTAKILKRQEFLFVVDVDKDKLWELYLESFPPGSNEIFRKRREHDCSCCRHFIKSFGNVVAIKGNELVDIWDFRSSDRNYQPSIDAMSAYVRSLPIIDIFIAKDNRVGTDFNYEKPESGDVIMWDHFSYNLPDRFKNTSGLTIDTVRSRYRSVKEVFKRSLEEISRDSVETVLELIAQKSLYKGDEWKGALERFLKMHDEYHSLQEKERDNYCWIRSAKAGGAIGKIKNHSIGVLLMDITNGMELDEAVKRYERIVAPVNYKRPKAIFTKKMVEQAQRTIEGLGLKDSLARRHASVEDITINNILFANKNIIGRLENNVFDQLKEEVPINPKKFSKVEEVQVDTFIKDILPRTRKIELLFEGRHRANLMSVIAPRNGAGKRMFKWGNNFSWAYNGNITDSMKERVKAAGGKVDGVLRFSIQWNEEGKNNNDFDAHCVEPNHNLIYYPNKLPFIHPSTGRLDVDIIEPRNKVAVENITWADINKMQEGIYVFLVHCFTFRGGRTGFKAELEYDGQIYSYEYDKTLRQDEKVQVAKVRFTRKEGIKFIESLPSSISSKKIWGIQTNQFQLVSICMLSPNYWDEQRGIGHKHYFFIVNGCLNKDRPNGFFNEFLREDLIEHKRVFEALGSKMRVAQSDNQLSGLGFSSTKRDSIICQLEGHVSRTIKILF